MRYFTELYKYFSDKRFSTIAGTLVYFLIMSVTPFLFWLSLLVGKADFSNLISNELFSAVAPVLEYLNSAAESATSGAGIVLIVTSLWSSTNFFYHLRRSGEIIYDTNIKRNGLRLRLSALLLVFATLFFIAGAVAVPFLSYSVLDFIMPSAVADVISLVFVTIFALFAAYWLNIFACPFRLDFFSAIQGSLLTTALWFISSAGFTIYLRFANPQKLYGAIAALIVFMLWCYIMINSLVLGIIYNSRICPRTRNIAPLYREYAKPLRR